VCNLFANMLKIFFAHSSMTQSAQTSKINDTVISSTSPFGDIEGRFETLSVCFVDVGIMFIPNLLHLLLRNYSFLDQLLSVDIVNRRSLANSLVHHGLSESKSRRNYAG